MTKKPINAFRKKRNPFTQKRKTPEKLNHRKKRRSHPTYARLRRATAGTFTRETPNSVLRSLKNRISLKTKFQYKNYNST